MNLSAFGIDVTLLAFAGDKADEAVDASASYQVQSRYTACANVDGNVARLAIRQRIYGDKLIRRGA